MILIKEQNYGFSPLIGPLKRLKTSKVDIRICEKNKAFFSLFFKGEFVCNFHRDVWTTEAIIELCNLLKDKRKKLNKLKKLVKKARKKKNGEKSSPSQF